MSKKFFQSSSVYTLLVGLAFFSFSAKAMNPNDDELEHLRFLVQNQTGACEEHLRNARRRFDETIDNNEIDRIRDHNHHDGDFIEIEGILSNRIIIDPNRRIANPNLDPMQDLRTYITDIGNQYNEMVANIRALINRQRDAYRMQVARLRELANDSKRREQNFYEESQNSILARERRALESIEHLRNRGNRGGGGAVQRAPARGNFGPYDRPGEQRNRDQNAYDRPGGQRNRDLYPYDRPNDYPNLDNIGPGAAAMGAGEVGAGAGVNLGFGPLNLGLNANLGARGGVGGRADNEAIGGIARVALPLAGLLFR